MKTYSLNDALFDESGQRWVPASVAQGLYDANKALIETSVFMREEYNDMNEAVIEAEKAMAAADRDFR